MNSSQSHVLCLLALSCWKLLNFVLVKVFAVRNVIKETMTCRYQSLECHNSTAEKCVSTKFRVYATDVFHSTVQFFNDPMRFGIFFKCIQDGNFSPRHGGVHDWDPLLNWSDARMIWELGRPIKPTITVNWKLPSLDEVKIQQQRKDLTCTPPSQIGRVTSLSLHLWRLWVCLAFSLSRRNVLLPCTSSSQATEIADSLYDDNRH